MHGYLGITCHFVTKEWNILSLLLLCSNLHCRHTAENILSEFVEVIRHTGISLKVYRIVTDNASICKESFPKLNWMRTVMIIRAMRKIMLMSRPRNQKKLIYN